MKGTEEARRLQFGTLQYPSAPFIILLQFALFAQTPSQPVIRVTTRLVEVNAIVRDNKGKLVEGLTRDDFVLLDNGRPQKIAVFATSSGSAVRKPPAPLPPNVYTNNPARRAETPLNVTVVLIDGLNTPMFDKAYARDQLIKFLKQIHPEDRVAVYALGRKLVVLNDFTNDSRRLLTAVDGYKEQNLGTAEATDPNSPDYGTAPDSAGRGGLQDGGLAGFQSMLDDARQAFADFATLSNGEITAMAIEAIANHLASLPGRKNLVWITSSIPLKIDLAMRFNKAQAADRDLLGEQTYRAMKALNDADIAVYPVDARGLIPGPALVPSSGSMTRQQAMRGGPSASSMSISASHDSLIGLALATGGRAFYNNNDISGAIRRTVDDSEFTYSLGFYPESGELDSTFHEIKLRVAGKNYEVRSRNGYRALPETATSGPQREKLIQDALWSPVAAAGIELAVRAEKIDQPTPGTLQVAIAVDSKSLVLEQKDGKWTGAVDYVIAQRAADGRMLHRKAQGVALTLDPEQYRALLGQGLTFHDIVEPVAGAMELRVVLLDRTSGRIGSVMVPLGR